jgi:broad specificity phosphatase PhoE
MMLRLLFTRHGQSEWQVLRDEANSDGPLTELGRRQADLLGCWLASRIQVEHIYTSPLQRAQQSAQLIAAHLDLPIYPHQGLREASFLTAPELPALPGPLDILDGKEAEGTEAYRTFRSQVAGALRDILDQHPEGTNLIVAHVGTIATAIRLLVGSDAFSLTVSNATLHSLAWTRDRWQLGYVDRRDHLLEL